MIRDTGVPEKLLSFEGQLAFLVNEYPNVLANAISSYSTVKFGSKIQIEYGDVIIITVMMTEMILVSISKYVGFGKFQEKYMKLAQTEEILEDIARCFSSKELNIVKCSIAALKDSV